MSTHDPNDGYVDNEFDPDKVVTLGNAWITFGDLLDEKIADMSAAQFDLINGGWRGEAANAMSFAFENSSRGAPAPADAPAGSTGPGQQYDSRGGLRPLVEKVVVSCWDMGESLNYFAMLRSEEIAAENKAKLASMIAMIIGAVIGLITAPLLEGISALAAGALSFLASVASRIGAAIANLRNAISALGDMIGEATAAIASITSGIGDIMPGLASIVPKIGTYLGDGAEAVGSAGASALKNPWFALPARSIVYGGDFVGVGAAATAAGDAAAGVHTDWKNWKPIPTDAEGWGLFFVGGLTGLAFGGPIMMGGRAGLTYLGDTAKGGFKPTGVSIPNVGGTNGKSGFTPSSGTGGKDTGAVDPGLKSAPPSLSGKNIANPSRIVDPSSGVNAKFGGPTNSHAAPDAVGRGAESRPAGARPNGATEAMPKPVDPLGRPVTRESSNPDLSHSPTLSDVGAPSSRSSAVSSTPRPTVTRPQGDGPRPSTEAPKTTHEPTTPRPIVPSRETGDTGPRSNPRPREDTPSASAPQPGSLSRGTEHRSETGGAPRPNVPSDGAPHERVPSGGTTREGSSSSVTQRETVAPTSVRQEDVPGGRTPQAVVPEPGRTTPPADPGRTVNGGVRPRTGTGDPTAHDTLTAERGGDVSAVGRSVTDPSVTAPRTTAPREDGAGTGVPGSTTNGPSHPAAVSETAVPSRGGLDHGQSTVLPQNREPSSGRPGQLGRPTTSTPDGRVDTESQSLTSGAVAPDQEPAALGNRVDHSPTSAPVTARRGVAVPTRSDNKAGVGRVDGTISEGESRLQTAQSAENAQNELSATADAAHEGIPTGGQEQPSSSLGGQQGKSTVGGGEGTAPPSGSTKAPTSGGGRPSDGESGHQGGSTGVKAPEGGQKADTGRSAAEDYRHLETQASRFGLSPEEAADWGRKAAQAHESGGPEAVAEVHEQLNAHLEDLIDQGNYSGAAIWKGVAAKQGPAGGAPKPGSGHDTESGPGGSKPEPSTSSGGFGSRGADGAKNPGGGLSGAEVGAAAERRALDAGLPVDEAAEWGRSFAQAHESGGRAAVGELHGDLIRRIGEFRDSRDAAQPGRAFDAEYSASRSAAAYEKLGEAWGLSPDEAARWGNKFYEAHLSG
ncbi:hypothetical protein, partial [Actinoallomurus rhizosphaericola]|uniref:hypothetical protein n=1 Tax=Actinoallomurus rhizosphaericola TaxID=2952536 RepID=UPI0038730CD6|nr:hypothetical protein [Actinoallomurus rhizosphaericola]